MADGENPGGEEEWFLLRPDGECIQMVLSEEQRQIFFGDLSQISLTSETTTLTFSDGGFHHRKVSSRTYTVPNQDSVAEEIERMVNKSYLNFPGAKRKEEQIAQKLDFVFEKTHGGNTTALVVPGISGQFILFVEDANGGQEK